VKTTRSETSSMPRVGIGSRSTVAVWRCSVRIDRSAAAIPSSSAQAERMSSRESAQHCGPHGFRLHWRLLPHASPRHRLACKPVLQTTYRGNCVRRGPRSRDMRRSDPPAAHEWAILPRLFDLARPNANHPSSSTGSCTLPSSDPAGEPLGDSSSWFSSSSSSSA